MLNIKNISRDDLNQKYRHSYIFNLESNVPFYVAGFEDERGKGMEIDGMLCINNMYTPYKKVLKPEAFTDEYPTLGVINHQGYAVHTARTPNRQFSKGLNFQYVIMRVLNEHLLHRLGIVPEFNLVSFVPNVYKPLYYSVPECVRDIKEGKALQRAFTNKFSICHSIYGNDLLVFYKNKGIGKLVGNSMVISSNYVHLIEELGQYHKVEVA